MSRVYRVETRKRGFVGQFCKWGFVGFNALMVWSLWADLLTTLTGIGQGMSAVASTVGWIASSFSGAVLVILWLAGAVILALLTFMTRSRMIVLIDER
ncbi:hypothetical protein [Methylobacterium nigriterrae]|uniref:hypothetical protein n=1 Tax=Methylobacterium nigriterrae TaxID=3127512 RepID=UPI003013537C